MKQKTRKKMQLIDAAYKDCVQMLRQDESYRAYIGNISKEIGKGLNIRQIQERDRRAQQERARSYTRALFTGDMNAPTDDDENGNEPCLPVDSAKHNVLRTYSRKNPTQKKKRQKVEDEDENVFDSDISSIHEDELEEVPSFIDEDYIRSVRATKIVLLIQQYRNVTHATIILSIRRLNPQWIWFSPRKQNVCAQMVKAERSGTKYQQMLSSVSGTWHALKLNSRMLRRKICT